MRDPRSGIRKRLIPDPGSRGQKAPDPQHCKKDDFYETIRYRYVYFYIFYWCFLAGPTGTVQQTAGWEHSPQPKNPGAFQLGQTGIFNQSMEIVNNDYVEQGPTRGVQIDVVYLCWPIAPAYASPSAWGMGGGGRRGCGCGSGSVSSSGSRVLTNKNWKKIWSWKKLYFLDKKLQLTYPRPL